MTEALQEKGLFPACMCPTECSSGIPGSQNQRFIFVPVPRKDYAVLDVAKVADFICVVMSCKATDYSKIKLDPDTHCHAIDDLGYKHINMLRTQGMPVVLGALQHLDAVPNKRQAIVKKFFQRYFESEFSEQEKFFVLNKKEEGGNYESTLKHIMRHVASASPDEMSWRRRRSYFIVDKCKYNEQEGAMETYGYVSGDYFTTQLPVHITGYGTYQLSRIETEDDPMKSATANDSRRKEEMKTAPAKIVEIADPTKQEPIVFENPVDPFAAEQTWPTKAEMGSEMKSAKAKEVKMKTIAESEEVKGADGPVEEELMSDSDDGEEAKEGKEDEVDKAGAMSEHESDKDDEEEKDLEETAEDAIASAK